MFSNDLKQAMKEQHISAKDLAEYLGLKPVSVEHWIYGRNLPSEKYKDAIFDLLDMSREKYVEEFANAKSGYRHRAKIKFDGDKLRNEIAKKRLDQGKLAKLIGVSSKTVSNWCTGGTPSQDNLDKLNQVFHTTDEFWSPNVQEPFTPQPQVDPKVKEKEKNWRNPYSMIGTQKVTAKDLTRKELKDVRKMADKIKADRANMTTEHVPGTANEILKARHDDSFLSKIKQLESDIVVLTERVENIANHMTDSQPFDVADRIDLIEFDYKLQVDALNDRCNKLIDENEALSQAVNDLRKLLINYLLKNEKPELSEEPEQKKSWWARLWFGYR